jgi:Acetyltransferase (GNAT) family
LNGVIVRRATANDAAALSSLIDGFASGHPAALHRRPMETMRDAFFGDGSLRQVLLAERNGTAIGFGIWRKTFDLFWSMYGGQGIGLYVRPLHRSSGAALSLITAMCAEIQAQGGRFLETSYDPDLAKLYERVGVGRPERACHISSMAFATLAGLAGKSGREIVRGLPDKSLNFNRRPA